MYADSMTNSMRRAIEETNRRRRLQMEYNERWGITPATVRKAVREVIEATRALESQPQQRDALDRVAELRARYRASRRPSLQAAVPELPELIRELDREMRESARRLDFEQAAELRDLIIELKGLLPSGREAEVVPGRGLSPVIGLAAPKAKSRPGVSKNRPAAKK
jgi:excinuclease ABC subunit B